MNVAAVTASSSPAAAALAAAVPPASPGADPSGGQVTAAQRHKAAQQFEAILVRQLLSQSVGSMMGGTGHTAGLMYGDLMTDVLAQNLTSGKGLGLGSMIETQLTPRSAQATHAAAPPVQRP
jgi:Rod binding domain-containing protein